MNPALPKPTKIDAIRKSGVKNRLPVWFRQDIPDTQALTRMRLLSQFNIHTVCQEAKCPNFSYCFQNLRFTFMLLGDTCTRNCRFCAVKKSSGTVREPFLLIDLDESYRITEIVKELSLNYVVITSVTRDDLGDGGAGHFARTIELIHGIDKNIKIEVLIPDFSGNTAGLKTVINAHPSLLAHNMETVKRLYPVVRPKANYEVSLEILSKTKEFNSSLVTKSSLILGLGETEDEVMQTMEDLRDSQCDILTLGQYLAPSEKHYPVQEFISIEQFKKYEQFGLALGFKAVLSGPKVRSSYQAEKVYKEVLQYA
jgi:lipoic acid synthetase